METEVERKTCIEETEEVKEDVGGQLEIRQRKRGIMGKKNLENEVYRVENSVYFEEGKDINGDKENINHNINVFDEEKQNLSDATTENGSISCYNTLKKSENEIQEPKEVAEYDLERVLEEQETYDLFCPNCRSCITKRVILRKRKRTPKEGDPTNFPPAKLPDIPGSSSVPTDFPPGKLPHFPDSSSSPTDLPSGNLPDVPDSNRLENIDEDDLVFRCLSCFCFFIPADRRYNIFRVFGKSDGSSNLPSSKPSREVSCMSFLFGSGSSNNNDTEAEDDIRSPLLPKESTESSPDNHGPRIPTARDVVLDVGVPDIVESRTLNEWDILKSIVYGGLIESITSLGIVSSAAGSGSSTLNICALGLANLVTGFFVLSHSLSELRSTHNTESTKQTEEQLRDIYFEKLGKRENFKQHAFFSVLSYIIFGLLPPVIYGFAFRESNNKENKLISVATSSFLCIAMLAIGKAHASSQKKYIKSILYYIGLALPASGLTYVAGVMINKLFVKLCLFD